MRYRIISPARGFTGEVAGVAFVHSSAEVEGDTNGRALAYFRRKGYSITPVEAAPKPDEVPVSPEGLRRPRNSASKADWKAYAIARGMDADEAEELSRDQLVERFPVDEGDNK